MDGSLRLLMLIIISIISTSLVDADVCPTIISRSQWQSRRTTSDVYLITPIPYAVIHHTVTPECDTVSSCASRVRNIQDYHIDELDYNDIGFSFLVGGDGNVYEGVGWNTEGAHTYGYNKKSIGVAFIGSYQRQNATQKMIDAAHKLILCGVEKNMLRPDVKVIAGSQVTSTASPGRKLLNQIKAWPEWSAIL